MGSVRENNIAKLKAYSPTFIVSLLVGISLTLGGCGGGGKQVSADKTDLVCVKRADVRLVVATLNRDSRGIEVSLQEGADANASIEGLGPPIVIAALADNYAAVKLLLDKGASINASDGEGSTALTNACFGNNKDIVQLLLARGADANVPAYRLINGKRVRFSALMIAKSKGNEEIVKSLTAAGAKE